MTNQNNPTSEISAYVKSNISSKEAEEAVLASVLKSPEVIERLEGWLTTGELFYYQKNRRIWQIMLELRKERKPIDTIMVIDKWKDKYGTGENIAYELTGLVENLVTIANCESYARIIQEKYAQKRLAESAGELQAMSYLSHEATEKKLADHLALIADLQNIQPTRYRPIIELVDQTLIHIKKGDDVISYGIKSLDAPASGMTRKEITVLGGRPGHGKSTMILNIIRSLIFNNNKVMLFNREMSNTASIQRLLVQESKILEYGNVRRGEFSESEAKDLNETANKIKQKYNKNLFMFDDIRDMPQAIREIRRHRPDVVIDDYIQLIGTKDEKFRARRFEIEYIMNEYKWIAKELNLSVFLVSQLSREIEKRIDPTPRMSDYSEGGTIEQAAECCLFVFYGYYFDHEDYDEYASQIIAAKTRYGTVGTYDIGFNGARGKFYTTKEEARADSPKNKVDKE